MKKVKLVLSVLVVFSFVTGAFSARIDDYFEYAKKNEALLIAFLNKMPKGAQTYSVEVPAVIAPATTAAAKKTKKGVQPQITTETVVPAYDLTNTFRDLFLKATSQNILYAQIAINGDRKDIEQWLENLDKAKTSVSETTKKTIGAGIVLAINKDYYPVQDPFNEREYLIYFSSQMAQVMASAIKYRNRGVGGIEILTSDGAIARGQLNNQLNVINRYWTAYKTRGVEINIGLKNSKNVSSDYSDEISDRMGRVVVLGHLKKIEPGYDIVWENNLYGLLGHLRENKVAVEINNLNRYSAGNNPYALYRDAGIPIIIRADGKDNLVLEYVRSARLLNLTYREMKDIAFNSLEYSFISGESLFENGDYSRVKKAAPANSQKALLQKQLLDSFSEFENSMTEIIRTDFSNTASKK